ncbi:MAG: hypothetical protein ABW022_08110 [Actinoplanes sp.]
MDRVDDKTVSSPADRSAPGAQPLGRLPAERRHHLVRRHETQSSLSQVGVAQFNSAP